MNVCLVPRVITVSVRTSRAHFGVTVLRALPEKRVKQVCIIVNQVCIIVLQVCIIVNQLCIIVNQV